MGKRIVLAATVVALLFGLINTPQQPAAAAGAVAFEHIFSDGDPFNRSNYEIPDDDYPCDGTLFLFRQGAYVLLVSASEVTGSGAPNVPVVEGKNLAWSLVDTHVFPTVNNATTRIAIFQAFAVNPTTEPLDDLVTFDFNGQTQLRHSRSFFQSTANNVEGPAPVLQFAWNQGTGTSAEVTLNSFSSAGDNATVFAVAKRSQEPTTPGAGLAELGDTVTGPTPCENDGEAHRLQTSWRTGQDLTPSASWSTSTAWHAVAIEVTASAAGGGPTTTTTQPTTSTTQATTTTTQTTPTTTAATTTTTQPATTTTLPGSTTTTTEPPATSSTTMPPVTPPTTAPLPDPEPDLDPFVDDDGSVFENDIEAVAAAGVTRGCNPPANDRFCPEDTVTRGQMAAFMARLLGLTGSTIDRFVDDNASVFENDIELVAHAGITLGCNPPANDRFCPEGTLTRGQMAAFVARALGLSGDTEDRFLDDDDSPFEAEIELVARAGITLGCNPPDGDRFCPNDTLTRGQMAAFLNRMLQYLEG